MDIHPGIRRGLKIVRSTVLALLLAVLAVMVVVRNLPPSGERKEALALLHSPTPPVRGRDGSDALWLLPYDVSDEQQPEVAAALRRYLVEHDRLVVEKKQSEADALPDPRLKLRAFGAVEGNPDWLCAERGFGCLEAAARDPLSASKAMEEHARGLAALARLIAFDGTRYGLPPSYTQELPSWGKLRRLLRTSHALDFVQGRQVEAMSGLCRETAAWRRHGADTDMLVGSMVAAGYSSENLRLLSEMLADTPAGTSLPVECDEALAPTRAEELDLCPSFRFEFASVEKVVMYDMKGGQKPVAKALTTLALDADHSLAVMAPSYAVYCGEVVHGAAAMDRRLAGTTLPTPQCGPFERIGDPFGCWLAEVSASDWSKYQDRRTDLAAKIALMRTLVWVRAHGTGTQGDFDRRPASLGLRRQPQVSADGREVSIELFETSKEKRYSLRLSQQEG